MDLNMCSSRHEEHLPHTNERTYKEETDSQTGRADWWLQRGSGGDGMWDGLGV